MNELIKTGAVCLMASMMTGYAFAGTVKAAAPKKENKPQNLITTIIAETKLSDDGTITYEEFKAARETVIKKRIDKMKAAREKRDKEKFLSLDKNKDGKVSKAELLELQKQFAEGGRRGRFGHGRGSQGMGRHGMRPGMGGGMGPQNGKCDMNCDGKGSHHGMQRGQCSGFGKGQRHGGGRKGLEVIMLQADKDKDGALSKEEVNAAVLKFFDKLDANKDGKLDKSELPARHHRHRHNGRKMKSPKCDTKEISTQVDNNK